jgi:hypothetical protein
MAGTLIATRARVKRIREAVARYCEKKLGDPDAIIEILPQEEIDKFVVVVASPKFKSMPYSQRQDEIWDFLFADPATNKDDLFEISRIMTESE